MNLIDIRNLSTLPKGSALLVEVVPYDHPHAVKCLKAGIPLGGIRLSKPRWLTSSVPDDVWESTTTNDSMARRFTADGARKAAAEVGEIPDRAMTRFWLL